MADGVPPNNIGLSIDNSESSKYKAALVVKTADAVDNSNNSVKNTKNSCSIKIFE